MHKDFPEYRVRICPVNADRQFRFAAARAVMVFAVRWCSKPSVIGDSPWFGAGCACAATWLLLASPAA